MTTSIRQLMRQFSPWWLRMPFIGTVLDTLGTELDIAVEEQLDGLIQGNPLKCDADALPKIGVNRTMRRYSTETEAAYRARLAKWRQAYKIDGSHKCQLEQLRLYLAPETPIMHIVHQMGDGSTATWHSMDEFGRYSRDIVTPSNWDWDGVPERWSRYWAIIHVDALSTVEQPMRWDAADEWDSGVIWDGYFTADKIADIVALLEDWQAAHTKLWGVILATDPASFDPTGSGAGYPDGTWGYPTNDAGDPTRLDTAIYSYDLGQADAV